MNGAPDDELRRRGLELQAALPVPSSPGPRWSRRRKKGADDEVAEMAAGTLDLFLLGGIWATLVAVPGVVVWVVRWLRRRR